MTARRFWLDGRVVHTLRLHPDESIVSAGDGVFETLRVEGGRPVWWPLHERRLREGLAALGLPHGGEPGQTDAVCAALTNNVTRAARWLAPHPVGRVRISVWCAPHGHLRTLVDASPLDMQAACAPLQLVTSPIPHPGLGQLGKTLSWGWSRAAVRLARAAGAHDALLCRDGAVVECATSTLLWAIDDAWYTAPRELGGLPSTTLAMLVASGLPVFGQRVTPTVFGSATALVALSATRWAVPVSHLDGRALAPAETHAAQLRDRLAAFVAATAGPAERS